MRQGLTTLNKTMGRAKERMYELEHEEPDYTSHLSRKYVSSTCFKDSYLEEYINQNGTKGICTYSRIHGFVMPMTEFMSFIRHRVLSRFTSIEDACLPTASSWFDDDDEEIPGLERLGIYAAPAKCKKYPETWSMLNALHIFGRYEDLNSDIINCFPDQSWIQSEPFIISLSEELSVSWRQFASMVMHKQRFTFLARPEFSGEPSHYDNCLFDILTELSSIINQFGLCKYEHPQLFRARPLSDSEEVETDFKEITSAPDKCSHQSRMSPAGISMFYGSYDEETPRIESTDDHKGNGRFLMGEFNPKRNLYLLDLTDIPQPSFWRDGSEELYFLHDFRREMSKPIDPKSNSKHYEYIPTQVFTEYLRYMYKDLSGNTLDGIKFNSSINGRVNVVLFFDNKSSASVLQSVRIWEHTN